MKNNADPLKSKDTSPAIVHRIEEYKRKLLKMRKSVVALKDALFSIEKGNSPIIKADQIKYYCDMKESCLQLMESIDALE